MSLLPFTVLATLSFSFLTLAKLIHLPLPYPCSSPWASPWDSVYLFLFVLLATAFGWFLVVSFVLVLTLVQTVSAYVACFPRLETLDTSHVRVALTCVGLLPTAIATFSNSIHCL